jgi:hypothetical protein
MILLGTIFMVLVLCITYSILEREEPPKATFRMLYLLPHGNLILRPLVNHPSGRSCQDCGFYRKRLVGA